MTMLKMLTALLAPLIMTPVLVQTATCGAQMVNKRTIKDVLRQQGFTGELTGKIAFHPLGSITCSAKQLQVFYYVWEELDPPGEAVHSNQRVIFVLKAQYLGSYAVEDRPYKMKPNALRFNYSRNAGNEIMCGRDGLPKSVLLNGESISLAK